MLSRCLHRHHTSFLSQMIPKTIHYCWFGGNPLPPLAQKCIASWKKYLPDYEIKLWDEHNFDVNSIPYTTEAYKAGKYAFVSDYARFWILFHHGGVYFDTDVEVIRPIDDIIEKGPFMGCEREADPNEPESSSGYQLWPAPGLGLACPPGLDIYAQFLDIYSKLHFKVATDGEKQLTIVNHTAELLCAHGLRNTSKIQLVAGIYIYPNDFFCPISPDTRRLHITDNTRTIHHFAASWMDKSFVHKLKDLVRAFIPESVLLWNNRRKRKAK